MFVQILDIAASPTTTVQLNLLGNFSEHNRPEQGLVIFLQPYIRFLPLRFPLRRKEVFGGGTTTYGNNPVANISGKAIARSQTRALFADIHLKQDLAALLLG